MIVLAPSPVVFKPVFRGGASHDHGLDVVPPARERAEAE